MPGRIERRLLLIAGPAALLGLLAVSGAGASEAGATADPPGYGWLSLVPPLLAIAMALILRQVVPALLAGIWVGAWLAFGGPLVGFLRTLDHFVIGALGDRDRLSILVFTLMLGGIVGVVSRAGGTAGLVELVSRRATTGRRGQFYTWLLGMVIFFDDYANTLVVGNTMRPVTDRLRISREKLAYLVDSTAAPVASIALISTWIGFEVSLIADALQEVGSPEDAYWIFLESLPYFFYPIFALAMVAMIALSGRDFGPMLRAERRAARGAVLAEGAMPLSDFDSQALVPVEGKPRRWFTAAVPVLTMLLVTFVGQYVGGRVAMLADGGTLPAGFRGFARIFSAGNSFDSLLYGAGSGLLMALVLSWGQRLLSLHEGLRSAIEGAKTMFMALVILTLAWSIGDVCRELGTANYLVSILEGLLDPRWLPLMTFVFAAVISFSTGSSWTTMTILVPLAVPSAFMLAREAGLGPEDVHHVLVGSVASVLAGAIFGDHCSPISDTTVMSSMASGCDHIDHVRTQLPYALAAAGVAVALGSIPAGLGASPWISLPLGLAALWALVRWLGKPLVE